MDIYGLNSNNEIHSCV